MKKIALSIFTALLTSTCFATPKEVIIVRHADKWVQQNPGPFLSPKGQARAEKFVGYYLSHFPKPDFIFATNPFVQHGNSTDYSFRPVQTIAPLANQLAYQQVKGYDVNTIYHDNEYAKLADTLLHNPAYNHKTILICWHHGYADSVAKALGVTQKLSKWHGDNYDQVYVLQYGKNGKLASFQSLENQYPMTSNPTWVQLANQTH